LVVTEVGVGTRKAGVEALHEHVENVGGVGELRHGLPQWGGQEAVGQSPVSLHASKDHPAETQGPGHPGEGQVEGLLQNWRCFRLLGIFEDRKYAAEEQSQAQ